MANVEATMTSPNTYASSLQVFLLMTSSLACNVRMERDRPDVGNTTELAVAAPSGPETMRADKYRPGSREEPSNSGNYTTAVPVATTTLHQQFLSPTISLRPSCPRGRNKDKNSDKPPSDLNSTDDHDSEILRHRDITLGDLTSLFASSSPGDLLDDAEIDELINAEGIWTDDQQVKTKLKPIARTIARNGLVSRKMYRQFSRVIVYIAFPLIIVGCVTNVIALKVFRGLTRNVTNTYMTCLICFDMAYLLFVVSSHIVVVVFRAAWAQSSARHFLQLYVVYKFFILSARQVIIMATAFMSLDRYFVIASPFRTHNIFLFRRPKLLILLAALLILAFNSHKLLKREVKTGTFSGTNKTVSYLAYSHLYLRNHGLLDDLTIASSCLFQYCPLFAMLAANIALMTSLHKYSRRVSEADVASKDTFMTSVHNGPATSPSRKVSQDTASIVSSEHSTVSHRSKHEPSAKKAKTDKQFFHLERHKCVTVIAYSLLFFLLALPLALLPILKKVFPEFNVFKSQHYLFLIYVRIFPLLDIISASINFFVFYIKGGAFRTGVCRIVRCQRGRPKEGTFKLRPTLAESDEPGNGKDVGMSTKSLSVVFKGSIKLSDK